MTQSLTIETMNMKAMPTDSMECHASPSSKTTTGKTSGKTREAYIEELFTALPLVEGFPLTNTELWSFFEKAVKDPKIPCRKFSVKKDQKEKTEPKRISGYNLFIKEWSGEVPKDVKKITHTSGLWKKLSKEEQTAFNDRASKENEANGIMKKEKKMTKDEQYQSEIDDYCLLLQDWTAKGRKEPMPVHPRSKVDPSAIQIHE